jgi:hypothetical protein
MTVENRLKEATAQDSRQLLKEFFLESAKGSDARRQNRKVAS